MHATSPAPLTLSPAAHALTDCLHAHRGRQLRHFDRWR